MVSLIFNKESVLNLLEGDIELFCELATLAESETSSMLIKLHEASEIKNKKDITYYAHTMRSALANLGADKCCDTLLLLEEAAEEDQAEQVKSLLKTLVADLDQYFKEVQAFEDEQG